ncbi:MAG: hypothetical protein N2Z62_10745 [Rhodobacteraceae bacterium]|nr:hypothetical protein [Paracoccaceae bacterium]
MPDARDSTTAGDLDLSDVFAEAQRQVRASRGQIETEAQKAAAENSRRLGRDRSWIATTIIVTYGAAVLGVILYVMLSVPACQGDAAGCTAALGTWQTQGALLSDLIVTAVLPVVTLMLGFYFGTENARGGGAPE